MTPLERQLDRLERGVLLRNGITPEDPPAQIQALLAAIGKWDEALHPRGRDGRFIEKFGFLTGTFNWKPSGGDSDNPLGGGTSKKVSRAKVVGFSSGNGATAEDPWVKVEYEGPDPDLQGQVGFARASEVSQAAETKARLDGPDGQSNAGPPTPREAQAAEAVIGPERVDEITDGAGLSGATPEQLQQIVDEANEMSDGPEPDDALGMAPDVEYLRDRVHGEAGYVGEYSGRARAAIERQQAEGGGDAAPEDRAQALRDRVHFRLGDERPVTLGGTIGAQRVQEIFDGDGDVEVVTSVDDALAALEAGKKVEIDMPSQVSILLDRMVEMVNDAKAKGEAAPNYNLCEVTLKAVSVFCAEHKGIPRIQMPQLMGQPVPGTPAASMTPDERGNVDLNGAFRKMLEDRGIPITDETMPSSHLKASQNELNGPKVAGIANAMENGTFDPPEDGLRLFVSNDDYIVDGHHRWAANIATSYKGGDDPPMDVAKVDMGIIELLAEANRFANEQGIAQASAATVTTGPDADAPSVEPIKPEGAGDIGDGKVYDRTAADYGLNFRADLVDSPELAAARELPQEVWDSKPVESVDPKTMAAVEDELRSGPIDKVVNGDVPLREGYVAKAYRMDDGTLVIADGHHRAAMAAAMDRDLDVQIVDKSDLGDEPQLVINEPETTPSGGPGDMPNDPELQVKPELADHPLAPRVNALMAQAEYIEQTITPLLVDTASKAGGEMTGLKFRFKEAGKIDKKDGKIKGVIEKILRKVEASQGKKTADDVVIDDALRYTATFDPENYTAGVRAIIDSLREAGYVMPDENIKNSWNQHDGYNGINAIFIEPETGMGVELQFHTPESWIAKGGDDGKQGTHDDYEIVRDMSNTPQERRAAFERMVGIADSVQFPEDMEGLLSIGSETRRDFVPGGREAPAAAPEADVSDTGEIIPEGDWRNQQAEQLS